MPVVPSWMRRLSWQTFVLALVSGGIIHISATLIMPRLAAASAFHRLAAGLPVNRMRVLPPATAEAQPLPFVGPDVRLAVCRFDVSDSLVTVTALLPDKGWTLGLYSAHGDNFYVVPAQDFRRSEVTFTLAPQTDRFLGFINLGRVADTSASQISVPEPQGLIVLRAPIRGRAYQAETEAILQRAQCSTQRG